MFFETQNGLIGRDNEIKGSYIQKLYLKFKIYISPKFRKQFKLEINRMRYWHNEYYYTMCDKKQNIFQNTSPTLPIELSKKDFWVEVKNRMGSPQLVVDLGSGVRPFTLFRPKYQILVEKYDPYLNHLKVNQTNQNSLIINSDVFEFIRMQPSNSLDTIVVNDVTEHLDKTRGYELVHELERVVKNKVLIFTPNEFMKQHIGENDDDGWGFYGNMLQNHLSGWGVDDFPGWDLILCSEYHLDQGYQNGVIAAIYSKHIKTHKERILFVYPNEIDFEIITFLNKCNIKINRLKAHYDVSYLMHTNLSPRGHTIHKNLVIPEGVIYFSTREKDFMQGKFTRKIFMKEFLNFKYDRIIIFYRNDLFLLYKDNLKYQKINTVRDLNEWEELIEEITVSK